MITFRDINEQKKAQDGLKQINAQLEQAWYLTPRVFDMHLKPLLVLDEGKQAIIANTALEGLFNLPASEIQGGNVFDLLPGVQDADLAPKLEATLQGGHDFESEKFDLQTREGETASFVPESIVKQEQDEPP